MQASFGKLFSCPVDGEIYTEPLVVNHLAISAGTHNVVFVGTENDSVYAFDADARPCVQYWRRSFLGPGVTTVSPAETGEIADIDKQVGITGTPVIDVATHTLYVVAKTRETSGAGCTSGSPCHRQRLHALDLATGVDKFNGPALLSPALTVPGSGDSGDSTCPSSAGSVPFCSLHENQRGGLLLLNGRVYVAWGSHGDNQPYHGWVIAYSAANLAQPPTLFNLTPNGEGAGVWMSGAGLAADSSANLYLVSGDGTFAPAQSSFGDSFLKLSTGSGISVADYFTPSNESVLNGADFDLGSGGVLVLPDAAGSPTHPHLLVGGDKQYKLYLIDRDNMGTFHAGGDQIVQTVQVTSSGPCLQCGIFSTPLYFQGRLYVVAEGDVVKQYSLSNAQISNSPTRTGSEVFGFPGATPVMSSNAGANAILWVIDTASNGTPNGTGSDGPAILYAYDPVTLAVLYSSPTSGTGAAGDAVKFAVPTVINGKVYFGTQTELSVFGLL